VKAGATLLRLKSSPADNVFVNGLPCIPDLPCNNGWDYDDINAVGASTDSQKGTGLTIATPVEPDGYHFEFFVNNGDTQYNSCESTGFCFHVWTHQDNLIIRERFQHIFRDNRDGTLSFGIEGADGRFD